MRFSVYHFTWSYLTDLVILLRTEVGDRRFVVGKWGDTSINIYTNTYTRTYILSLLFLLLLFICLFETVSHVAQTGTEFVI